MASDREYPTPSEQVQRLYDQFETQAEKAAEGVVGSGGFATLLGQLAENTAALTKLGYDAMDLALRNLRLAGRRDVVRLSRQLARNEDKLERVLQELEEVRSELDRSSSNGRTRSARSRSSSRSSSSRSSNRRSNGSSAAKERKESS